MPIEFRCAGCQRLLRVADAMAGRQARCPSCGQIQLIPSPAAGTPDAPATPPMQGTPGTSGIPGAQSGSDFAGPQGFGAPAAPAGPTYPPAGPPPGAPPFGPPPSAYPPQPQDFGPVNPYQTPSADTSPMPSQFAAGSGAIVPTRLDIGRALSAGWTVYKNELGTCLGLVLLTGIILIAFSFAIQMALLATFGAAQMAGNPWMPGAQRQVGALSSFGLSMFSQFLQMVVSAWIMAGLNLCLLRLARGQTVNFGELFAGGRYWPRVFVGQILLWLVSTAVGFVIGLGAGAGLLAGGIRNPQSIGIAAAVAIVGIGFLLWMQIRLGMFSLAILDRDVGVTDAFGTVFRITQGNVLPCIGLLLVVGIPGTILGVITCLTGFLFVVPFWAVIYVVAYLHMSGQITKGDEGWMPSGGYGPTTTGYPAGGYPAQSFPQAPYDPYAPQAPSSPFPGGTAPQEPSPFYRPPDAPPR